MASMAIRMSDSGSSILESGLSKLHPHKVPLQHLFGSFRVITLNFRTRPSPSAFEDSLHEVPIACSFDDSTRDSIERESWKKHKSKFFKRHKKCGIRYEVSRHFLEAKEPPCCWVNLVRILGQDCEFLRDVVDGTEGYTDDKSRFPAEELPFRD